MTRLQFGHARLYAETDGPVARIVIDNPARRNAFDLGMWQALPLLVGAIEADQAIRVIVLRGAGDLAFASGADIAEFETVRATAEGGRAYEQANEAAFAALTRSRLPVIAMIRGFCLGGGLGLAVSCDLRIASHDAVFGIPAARLGVGYPPGAMASVVATVGAAAAKDLFFTARRIDAEEALRLGLVSRLVAPENLADEADSLALGIAENAPLTITAAKRAIDAASGLPGAPDTGELVALAGACFDSEDYREGRTAFLDKRKPRFTGR